MLIDFDGKVKLADFGLARFYTSLTGAMLPENVRASAQDLNGLDSHLTNRVVTLWYRPPELLLGARDYTIAADLWSIGCIMYEMLLGTPAFPASNEFGVLQAIFRKLGPPSEQNWPEYAKLPLTNSVQANPMMQTGAADEMNLSKDPPMKSKVFSRSEFH